MSKKNLASFCLLVFALSLPALADVSVSSPWDGAAFSSPVHFVASGSSDAPVVAVQVYADNQLVFDGQGSSIDTWVPLNQGWHYIVVKSWDANGATAMSQMNINVTSAPASGVTISSPADGSTSGSPVHVVGSGVAPGGAVGMQTYVDGNLVYGNTESSLDTWVPVGNGWHNIAVKVWGPNGWNALSSVNVNVQNAVTAVTSVPATTGANAVYNIQQQPDWQSCTGWCSGGADVPYSMSEGRSNPSLSGNAAQFWLGGDPSKPYSNALWWKQLTPVTAANFKYEADFYLDNPNAAQSLEFDVNQTIDGQRYIFGTECDIRNTGTFRVWDTANGRWVSTGVGCHTPAANQWNHIAWEFQRANGQAVFVAVTLNGTRYPINMSFWPIPVDVFELNVAFQMDGDYNQENFSTWVDNVTLTYW